MDNYQPLRDTFGLLAGNSVRRSERPGERFDPPQKANRAARARTFLASLVATLLLSVRFP